VIAMFASNTEIEVRVGLAGRANLFMKGLVLELLVLELLVLEHFVIEMMVVIERISVAIGDAAAIEILDLVFSGVILVLVNLGIPANSRTQKENGVVAVVAVVAVAVVEDVVVEDVVVAGVTMIEAVTVIKKRGHVALDHHASFVTI